MILEKVASLWSALRSNSGMTLRPTGGVSSKIAQPKIKRMSSSFQRWVRFMRASGCGRFRSGAAAFGDFGDGRLKDLQLGVRRTDGDAFFLYGHHGGDDAAGGQDLVAGLDGFEHFFLLLGARALR